MMRVDSDDDHFSDALASPMPQSHPPIPHTIVSRVDDSPSYGEVPGTFAYSQRTADATPDEMIIDNPWGQEEGQKEHHAHATHNPITLVEEVHGHSPDGKEEKVPKKHEGDAEPDLVVDRTAIDDEIEEDIERESGMQLDLSSPSPAKSTPGKEAGLAVPKSPELKAVDEGDIGTSNVHIPATEPEKAPKSPRLTITRERSVSEVQPLDLHAPLDETHLEPPASPQLQALDEYDISSSNAHDPSSSPEKNLSKSPRLKVVASPEIKPFPGHTRSRTSSFHLEAPHSPELRAIDRSNIHSTNVHDPADTRPRSPSLVVSEAMDLDAKKNDLTPPAFERVDTFLLEPPMDREREELHGNEVEVGESNVRIPDRVETPPEETPLAQASFAPPPAQESFDYDEAVDGAEEDDDDFGDFDDFDDFEAPPQAPVVVQPQPPLQTLKVPDFSSPHVTTLVTELVDTLFPPPHSPFSEPGQSALAPPPPTPSSALPSSPIDLTERSKSLWTQLAAPPPLSPPNWKQSKVRRLFLVSLGVPVDLDEILPRRVQRTLVLPSRIDTEAARGGQKQSTETPATGVSPSATEAPTQGQTLTVTSTSSDPTTPATGRRTPLPPPTLDLSNLHHLSATSSVRLSSMTDAELKQHVEQLRDASRMAGEALEYWLKKKEKAVGEKEAFEMYIENLVGYTRRVRGRK